MNGQPFDRIPPYLRGGPTTPATPASPPPANPPPAGPAADDIRQRPFILTSGRVDAADRDIDLETQVTLRPGPIPFTSLGPELQAILTLCADPVSIAEISATLRLHLGVTKILVADLRAAGYIDVHIVDSISQHSTDTILRVMRGLRAIS